MFGEPNETALAFADPVGLKEGEHFNWDEIEALVADRWTIIKREVMENHIASCLICYDVREDIMASRVV